MSPEIAPHVPPTHHVPETELFDEVAGYTSGQRDDALSLVVACHLDMCARCRTEAHRLEAIGGALLEAEEPQPLATGALEAVLARLDRGVVESGAPPRPTPAALPPELARLGLPAVLLDRLPESGARWRYVAPGVRGVDVPLEPGARGTVRIVRLRGGLAIPRHDHGAVERTLIFSGGLTDEVEGHFRRGDLAVRVPGQVHQQRVDPDEDCVALLVNGGSLIPRTWQGRLLRLIARP